MNAREKRVFEACRRAEGWVDANPGLVPPEVAGQVTTLKAANAAVAESAAQQDQEVRSTEGASVTVSTLRTALRSEHLVPIAHVARTLVQLTPELRVTLRVPRPRADNEKLIASANAIAEIGKQHEDVLAQHGLPTDFVAQLSAATAALKEAIDTRGQMRSRRAGATESARAELARSRHAVGALDVAFTRALRDDRLHLAEWRSARHVVARSVRSTAAKPATPVTPSSTSTSTTSTTATTPASTSAATTPATPVTPVAPVEPAATTVQAA